MAFPDWLLDTDDEYLLDTYGNALFQGIYRSSASAFIYGAPSAASSQPAFLRGPWYTSQGAFLDGSNIADGFQAAYLFGAWAASSSSPAFLHGKVSTLDNQAAFLRGRDECSSQEAFIQPGDKEVYVRELWATVLLERPWPWTRTRAFTEGTHRSQSLPAYMAVEGLASTSAHAWTASAFKRTRVHVFVDVIGYSKVSISAYLYGVDRSNTPAWIHGLDSNTWTLPAYTEGVVRTSTPAYIVEGWPHIPVFIQGVDYWSGSVPAYLECAGYVVESTPVYMFGSTDSADSVPAFCSGVGYASGGTSAFMAGVSRASTPAYLGGVYDPVDYIVLENSDRSISGRYRVMAEDYGDGVMQSGAQINKTIGGGTDIHTGKMFEMWSPVIKVRHTEEESGYGTVDDLETLYGYVSLDTPPTRVITFYDHNQVRREVMFLEDFSKVLRLLQVEGTTAWYYVRLIMLKVPE